MSRSQVVKYISGFILLIQVSLLLYSLFYLKGQALEEVHSIFLRITLIIGSGMMVILTRYFLRFSSIVRSSSGVFLVQVLCLLPALLIPVGGFIFAYYARSGGEYLLFFLIGLYHLVRYYSPILKIGGSV